MELKETLSNVEVVSERQNPNGLPIFKKIYIFLKDVRDGFIVGCRGLIGVDGCFSKEIMKGQLLVAVGMGTVTRCPLHG